MRDIERLSVRQVADRLGWERRETLDRLQELHDQHGGLLFRRRGGRTKYWVDLAALRQLWPTKFAADDFALVHQRIDRIETLAERAMRELGELRKHVRQGASVHDPDNS